MMDAKYFTHMQCVSCITADNRLHTVSLVYDVSSQLTSNPVLASPQVHLTPLTSRELEMPLAANRMSDSYAEFIGDPAKPSLGLLPESMPWLCFFL